MPRSDIADRRQHAGVARVNAVATPLSDGKVPQRLSRDVPRSARPGRTDLGRSAVVQIGLLVVSSMMSQAFNAKSLEYGAPVGRPRVLSIRASIVHARTPFARHCGGSSVHGLPSEPAASRPLVSPWNHHRAAPRTAAHFERPSTRREMSIDTLTSEWESGRKGRLFAVGRRGSTARTAERSDALGQGFCHGDS